LFCQKPGFLAQNEGEPVSDALCARRFGQWRPPAAVLCAFASNSPGLRQIRVHQWLKKATRDGVAWRKNAGTARNPAFFPVTCRPSPVTFEMFKNNSKKS
jgi:hypothetical protein